MRVTLSRKNYLKFQISLKKEKMGCKIDQPSNNLTVKLGKCLRYYSTYT